MRYDAHRAIVMRCEIGDKELFSAPFIVRSEVKRANKERRKFLIDEAAALAEQQLRNLYDRYLVENPESGVLLTNMRFDNFVDVYVPKGR